MNSIVPVLGVEALDAIPLLKDRVVTYIRALGHEPLLVNVGNVFNLERANPLKVNVPCMIISLEHSNWSLQQDLFRAASHLVDDPLLIAATGAEIPSILDRDREKLSLAHGADAPEKVKASIKLLYDHLSDSQYKVADLARDVGASESMLRREFKKWHDSTPGHTQHSIRMNQAARFLLRPANYSITDIMLATGYDERTAFDHAFGHYWKMSPTAYRLQARNSMKEKSNSLTEINNLLTEIS